jgi:hypothetical protein
MPLLVYQYEDLKFHVVKTLRKYETYVTVIVTEDNVKFCCYSGRCNVLFLVEFIHKISH